MDEAKGYESMTLEKKKRNIRVNTNVDLDPKFGGKIQPDFADAYWVIVNPSLKPGKRKLEDYFFITLLPETGDKELSKELLQEVLEDCLEAGDRYTAKEFKQEDWEYFDITVPVLCFDPAPLERDDFDPEQIELEYIWLHPPRHMMF